MRILFFTSGYQYKSNESVKLEADQMRFCKGGNSGEEDVQIMTRLEEVSIEVVGEASS